MGIIDRLRTERLLGFDVHVAGFRLEVRAAEDLRDEARASALRHWEQLEAFVVRHSSFKSAFVPFHVPDEAPPIVRAMGKASAAAGVGPMVTLPGALVEAVATDLSAVTRGVVVSAEGDTYAVGVGPRVFRVEPGAAIGVSVRLPGPYAFYTSSGRSKVKPAIGKARVVAALARHGADADAAASAVGLALLGPGQMARALVAAGRIPGVLGAVLLAEGRIGVWGGIEIVSAG